MSIVFSILFPLSALAQSQPVYSQSLSLDQIDSRLKTLEAELKELQATTSPENEELTKLKLSLELPEDLRAQFTGLGPSVSQVYFSKTPLSVGGFAEIHYTSEIEGDRATNLARLNTILGYRFTKGLLANTGISFQNGGSVAGAGAARVEFAYLDFIFNDDFGLRIGNILIPFGIINLRFEPTLYPMVQRPAPEARIIPTTWHENGALVYWNVQNITMQLAVVNANSAEDFEASTWIRAGRQGGSAARAQDAAAVFRAEYIYPQLSLREPSTLGISLYAGDSKQTNSAIDHGLVTLGAIHGEWRKNLFTLRALYTEGSLSDSDQIAAVTGEAIGKRVRGGHLILSYDILPHIAPIAQTLEVKPTPGQRELPVFLSYEYEDLHAEVPGGFEKDPRLQRDIYTVGLAYKPHPQVIIKADFVYEEDGTGDVDQIIETGLGFNF